MSNSSNSLYVHVLCVFFFVSFYYYWDKEYHLLYQELCCIEVFVYQGSTNLYEK